MRFHKILAGLTRAFACVLICIFPAAPNAAEFDDPADHVERVVQLMSERLSLMPHVARWKQAHGLPIQDAAREAAVLEATVREAQRLGLEPELARALFELQIELARQIQERVIATPRTDQNALRDLNSDLRPELDRIGKELLIALYLALPEFKRNDFASRYGALGRHLFEVGLATPQVNKVLRAVMQLRGSASSVSDRVAASGVLRIGTTGDYSPFTLERDAVLSGTDIDAAIELARSFHAKPVFVRTSWNTLLADYRAGRFDIAVGGISITPDRAAEAAFSVPYYEGGKTAIVRCGTQIAFDTLPEIDSAHTRVIVNPGGTNERFARERLTHAQLTVHPDNRTIFVEIAAGRADVMVTDDIEVELQRRAQPQLCRATPELFTHSEKAILLPQDTAFLASVNRWLKPLVTSGEMQRRIDSALTQIAAK